MLNVSAIKSNQLQNLNTSNGLAFNTLKKQQVKSNLYLIFESKAKAHQPQANQNYVVFEQEV